MSLTVNDSSWGAQWYVSNLSQLLEHICWYIFSTKILLKCCGCTTIPAELLLHNTVVSKLLRLCIIDAYVKWSDSMVKYLGESSAPIN